MPHLVFAGTKPFACYMDADAAGVAAAALSDAGVRSDVTVVEVVSGTPDDFAKTCDDYLKGKNAIISEVVSLLDA